MAPVSCGKCETEVVYEENGYECDGCGVFYHMKCGGALKKEINARVGSQRLHIYCEDCITKDPIRIIADNVKSIMKYIYKIDLTLQKQVEANAAFERATTTNAAKIEQIFEQLIKLPNEIQTLAPKPTPHNESRSTATYANIVGSGVVKPTVLIRPKNNTQKSSATLDEIKSIGSDVIVRDVRNVNGGGIMLTCETANDTMKVKQLVQQRANDKYNVELPAIKMPRIKIVNVCESFTDVELVNEIKLKNELVRNGKIEIKKVHTKKKDNGTRQVNDIIAEVDCVTFDALIKMKRICIGWHSYDVAEHLYLKRCFKCCGFSHIANECKHHVACSKCAGTHKAADCNNSSFECVNCKFANQLNGLNLDTAHHAWSKKCSILQKRLIKLRDCIQYSVVNNDK